MADVNANIGVEIDASNALAQLKALQRGLSQFHTSISRSSDAAAAAQRSLQKNLLDSINSIGGFSAELRTVRTTAESFTNALEKNKFSMGEYFRYAGASTKTFGKLFTTEFDTISKVAEDRVKKMQTQYIKMGRDATGAMKAVAVIPDKLDMGNYSTQLQMAAQRQAILNQLIKQGSTNLLNFGKNTQWAGRQLMVGFTLPLMTLGSTASRVFMDMETAAIKFRKVYGDLFTPVEETEKALDNIRQLASEFTKYGVAVSKTIDLAAQAAAAGFQGVDLQRQVEQANRLAVLGQVDQQQALETTISLQNAFKTSSAELAEQINFLNIVENQTVTSLEDITIAIPKVAPVIQQLGGDVKDLAFFLTAMREGGINASEGANALKSGLGSLINPTAKASAMLMDMGINIEKIVESNKGDLRATVVEFARALDTLDPLQRSRAIEQLFGKFQFARLSTLFANVIQDGNQASRVLDIAGESASSLAIIAEKELGITANSAMNKFRKAIEDLKVAVEPVGKIFLEVVTPFVEFISGILDRFNNLSEGTRKAIARITFIVGGLGPVVIMTFGLLANALANIIKVVNFVRSGFLRLSGQSAILGEQTQYLTMEQLEAAAVASSLEQAHSNLTQQFTVEAGALERLIGVYQRATTAANNFKVANPGMFPIPTTGRGTRPIRRAGGGKVSGPGTSTSDSIPAYLSNGEYVVKSDAVKQYGVPFFDSLNAQRFAGGGFINIASLISGLRKVGTRSPRSGMQAGAQDYGQMALRSGRNRFWRENPEIASGKQGPGEVLGHIYSNAFYKMFGQPGSTGSSPRKTASFLEAVGIKVKNKEAMYDVLPNQFVTIPRGFNTNLSFGRATPQEWLASGRKPEHLISLIHYAMSKGATYDQALAIASRALTRINSNIGRIGTKSPSTYLDERMFGNIVTNATRKELKVFGFNDGVLRVPGSGNKDTVPAMLTPGEAVVPKKQNRKYASLVRGIIADNIPGFNDGTVSAYERRKNKPMGGVLAPTAINTAHPEGLFSILDISSQDASQVLSIGMQDIIRQTPGVSVKGVEDEIKAWKDRNSDLLKSANERALQGVDLDEAFLEVRTKFNKDMEDLGGNVHNLRVASDRHLPRLQKDFEEAQTYAKRMGLDLRTAQGVTRLASDLPNNAIAQQLTTRGKFQSYNTSRAATMAGLGGSFTQYGVPSFFIMDELKDSLKDVAVSTEHLSTTVAAQADREQKSRGRETRAEIAERRSSTGVLDKGSKKRNKGPQKRKRGTKPTVPSTTTTQSGADMPAAVVLPGSDGGDNPPIDDTQENGKGTKKKGVRERIRGGLRGKPVFNPMSLFTSLAVLPMLDMIPDKLAGVDTSIAKTTAKFATLGLAFGPKGAIAGGIIGLGKGLYDKFLKPAEDTAGVTEAIRSGFASSESVAKLFGGQVSATLDDFTMMPSAVDEVTAKLLKAQEQAEQFKTIVDQLDESDPLKKFIEGLKGLSGTQLTGRVRSFVATQIATGALPVKEAENFTRYILTAAGSADKFGEVWKSIRASVSTEAKAIETQFKKLGDSYKKTTQMSEEDQKKMLDLEKQRDAIAQAAKTPGGQKAGAAAALVSINKQIDELNKKYVQGGEAAKNYGNAILTFFSNISQGNLSMKEINLTIKAISDSGLTAAERINAFTQAVLASGNEQAIKNLSANKSFVDAIGTSALNAKDQMYALIAVQSMGAALQQELDKVDGSSTKDRLARAAALGKKYVDLALAAAKITDPTKPTGGTLGGADGKANEKILSLLDKEIAALKKKADALKRVNEEINRNNEYQMKQMDLSNQIAQAKASGDYIGATILQQQQAFNTAEFNRETEQIKLEDRIRNLEDIAKRIENGEKLGSAEKSLLKSLSVKYPSVKAATGGMIKVSKYASGGLIKGPGTGTSDSIVAKLDNIPRFGIGGNTGDIRVSAGEYIVKKDAVDFYTPEVMNSINNKSFQPESNSVVYNTFNVDVSGVQDPKQAADLVMQRLQTISNKTNRTNIVSNNRSVAI